MAVLLVPLSSLVDDICINKFPLVNGIFNNIQLTELGIAESGYQIDNINSQNHSTSFSSDSKYVLTLKKDTIGSQILDSGDNVRIIALEPNIPILACTSCNGTISEINEIDTNNHHIIIDVNNGNPKELEGFPILLLKSEIDLTRRELESIDFVYKSTGRIQDIAFAMLGENVTRFGDMAFSPYSSS